MHVISKKTLIDFYKIKDFSDSKGQLESWYCEAKNAEWTSPAEVKEKYRSTSILKNNRIVFNIAGNKYRLVVRVNFESKTIFIRFIGTHKDYDKIDAENI
jgi:mRNA interferase HigB